MLPRVAFLFTHRIQYFTNLLDELQRRKRVEVAAFYAHETARISDTGFGRRIAWDNRGDTSYAETVLPDSAQRTHGPFFHSYSRRTFQALTKFAPKVVHLNGYNAALQWQGLLWAKLHRIPVVARGDGDALSAPPRSCFAPQAVLAKLFTGQVDHIFHQGAENEKFWLAKGISPGRMSWIPCVSDGHVFRVNAFPSPSDRDNFRKMHGVGPDQIIFVVSGKLESRKRPADAVEALARCSSGAARLWFLGSGPLEAELRNLAAAKGVEQKIHWFGFRNQTEMPAVLQAADVLVHPSEKDPWPYSILEGAIAGLALVLSDKVGSHPDLITKAKAGRTFSVGDIEQLANVMSTLMLDAPARHGYQEAARVEAARYTESAYCDRFEDTVRQLIL